MPINPKCLFFNCQPPVTLLQIFIVISAKHCALQACRLQCTHNFRLFCLVDFQSLSSIICWNCSLETVANCSHCCLFTLTVHESDSSRSLTIPQCNSLNMRAHTSFGKSDSINRLVNNTSKQVNISIYFLNNLGGLTNHEAFIYSSCNK